MLKHTPQEIHMTHNALVYNILNNIVNATVLKESKKAIQRWSTNMALKS